MHAKRNSHNGRQAYFNNNFLNALKRINSSCVTAKKQNKALLSELKEELKRLDKKMLASAQTIEEYEQLYFQLSAFRSELKNSESKDLIQRLLKERGNAEEIEIERLYDLNQIRSLLQKSELQLKQQETHIEQSQTIIETCKKVIEQED